MNAGSTNTTYYDKVMNKDKSLPENTTHLADLPSEKKNSHNSLQQHDKASYNAHDIVIMTSDIMQHSQGFLKIAYV